MPGMDGGTRPARICSGREARFLSGSAGSSASGLIGDQINPPVWWRGETIGSNGIFDRRSGQPKQITVQAYNAGGQAGRPTFKTSLRSFRRTVPGRIPGFPEALSGRGPNGGTRSLPRAWFQNTDLPMLREIGFLTGLARRFGTGYRPLWRSATITATRDPGRTRFITAITQRPRRPERWTQGDRVAEPIRSAHDVVAEAPIETFEELAYLRRTNIAIQYGAGDTTFAKKSRFYGIDGDLRRRTLAGPSTERPSDRHDREPERRRQPRGRGVLSAIKAKPPAPPGLGGAGTLFRKNG